MPKQRTAKSLHRLHHCSKQQGIGLHRVGWQLQYLHFTQHQFGDESKRVLPCMRGSGSGHRHLGIQPGRQGPLRKTPVKLGIYGSDNFGLCVECISDSEIECGSHLRTTELRAKTLTERSMPGFLARGGKNPQ